VSPLISAQQLLLADPSQLRIVDCRFSLQDKAWGLRQYQAGHLAGAVYADLERDLSGPVIKGVTGRHPLPDLPVLARQLGAWGIGETTTVVAYDEGSGAFAARLWWLLRYLGHERVQVLDGGVAAYVEAGGAMQAESNEVQSVPVDGRPFAARVQSSLVASQREVEARTERSRSLLFDARARDRFRGENETIDPVAGHIPGARSLPFMDNLEQGKFRSAAELRARWLFQLESEAELAESIVYCGSGVTACHLILAAGAAGLPWPRLYPGSYSEWIADGTRPVARGEESSRSALGG